MLSVKAAIRDSAVLRAAQDLSAPLIRRMPVEFIPAWLGKMHGISIPKRIVPLAKPSPASAANIKVIVSLVKSVMHVDGDLAECGVYRGHTLIPLGLYLAQNNIRKKLYGFDSFEGFGDVPHGGGEEDTFIR